MKLPDDVACNGACSWCMLQREQSLGVRASARNVSVDLRRALQLMISALSLLISHADMHQHDNVSVAGVRNVIVLACAATQLPDMCVSSLSTQQLLHMNCTNANDPFRISTKISYDSIKQSLDLAHQLLQSSSIDIQMFAVVRDCGEQLAFSLDCLERVNNWDQNLTNYDIRHSLSAAATSVSNCYDAAWKLFRTISPHSNSSTAHVALKQLNSTLSLIKISLSMFTSYTFYGADPVDWKLSSNDNYQADQISTPRTLFDQDSEWLSHDDRKLLEQPLSDLVPAVTVSLDGKSNFTSIQDAVDDAPARSERRYIIYIKAGTYKEIVRVPSNKPMIMFLGDGIHKTIITGNRNVGRQPGMTTYNSATVGARFLARDIRIQNTAGPEGYQAVALRIESDMAAFYKCAFFGYQDTLNAQLFRQFYKECLILGTVDFIFGYAAAFFQDCDINVRLAGRGFASNYIAAHGRDNPSQPTGFVFHRCTLNGTSEFMSKVEQQGFNEKTYLGRPWGSHAVTVFLTTHMESLIDPEGWVQWNNDPPPDTVIYGEYENVGPGADRFQRVPWVFQLNSTTAQPYKVQNFIQGDSWLPSTGFPYTIS